VLYPSLRIGWAKETSKTYRFRPAEVLRKFAEVVKRCAARVLAFVGSNLVPSTLLLILRFLKPRIRLLVVMFLRPAFSSVPIPLAKVALWGIREAHCNT
jgi:hypothetical protein